MFGAVRANKAGLLKHGYRSEVAVTAIVAAAPSAVWPVLRQPGSMAADEESSAISFVAPGTGPGVGEVHSGLYRDAHTAQPSFARIEIDDEEPPHYLRFSSFTGPRV